MLEVGVRVMLEPTPPTVYKYGLLLTSSLENNNISPSTNTLVSIVLFTSAVTSAFVIPVTCTVAIP